MKRSSIGSACIVIATCCVMATLPAGALRTYDWTQTDTGTAQTLKCIWGTSDSDIFAAGDNGTIMHFDGAAWTVMRPKATSNSITGIWGSSATAVFACTAQGDILKYDGRAWTASRVSKSGLNGLWGLSATDVYAVGDGAFYHYNGSSWQPCYKNLAQVGEAVWGSSAADVFVCGRYGLALHYNGKAWSPMTTGTTLALRSVWGSSATDVYAVGINGLILHYDGIIWSPMASMTTYDLNGVWGTTGTDVYAVGAAGTILRNNGYGWKAMASGTINTLGKIWGTGTNAYVAALAGYVYRHTPSAGAPVTGLRMGEYAEPAGAATLPRPMAATGSTPPASVKTNVASTSVPVITSSSSSSTTSVKPTTTTSKKTTSTSIQPTTKTPAVALPPPKPAGKPGGKLSTAFPVLVFPEPDKIESSFILRNTGEGVLNWRVDSITCSTPGHNWLKITPADGAIVAGARLRLVFTVSRQGLAPGIHRATVTIILGNGLQKRILVYLQVGKGKKGK